MGSVLSLHPRAVNILRADGLAVSIVAEGTAMSAMGVLANAFFQTPPDAQLMDMPVRMEDGVISFANLVSMDCSESPIWEGSIDAAAVRLVPIERIHSVRAAVLTHGKAGGLLGLLRNDPAENSFVTSGRKSLQDGRLEELVGFGPGLTPAGDDFLTGALLASSGSVFPDRSRLERVLPGTTPGGRTLLWMALQGRFPAYLLQFIDAIRGAGVSADGIDDAIRAACAHGETSGTDSLTGFCWQTLSSAG
jgi:hypothetical protein